MQVKVEKAKAALSALDADMLPKAAEVSDCQQAVVRLEAELKAVQQAAELVCPTKGLVYQSVSQFVSHIGNTVAYRQYGSVMRI